MLAPHELIVVDDGSTDNGWGAQIVADLQRKAPPRLSMRLLHQANAGQSAARNFGAEHASCDLLAFLDQDDDWYPHHLEVLVKPFLRRRPGIPLGWVYSDLDEIDEDGYLVCRNFLRTLDTAHPKTHIHDCLRQDMFVLPSASLIARSAFNAVGQFDKRLSGYEDDDLFWRLLRAGYDNVFIAQPLSRWRIHTGSASYTLRMARSRTIYAQKLLETYPPDRERKRFYARDLIAPRFAPAMLFDIVRQIRRGDLVEAARAVKRLAVLWPHVRWRWWLTLLPLALVLAVRRRLGRRGALSFPGPDMWPLVDRR
jgi:glycosyltransferase involved in cell wall biosynthesis